MQKCCKILFAFKVLSLPLVIINQKVFTMKKLLLVITFALSLSVVFAQKIKVDEKDKFTKKRIVQTSFEKISSDKSLLGSTGGRLMKTAWISFRKVGENEYLRLKWCSNQVLALSEDADVIFLDNEDNTYKFKNTDFTIAGEGEGTVGMYGSALYGLDIYLTGDISQFSGKKFTNFRINTTDGYIDFDIKKKFQKKLSDTYKVFKEATEKE